MCRRSLKDWWASASGRPHTLLVTARSATHSTAESPAYTRSWNASSLSCFFTVIIQSLASFP